MLKRLWQLIVTPPPVLMVVLTNLLILGVVPAYGHLKESAACFALQGKVKKVGNQDILPNGLWIERYDTDGDGKADLITLSHVKGQALDKKGNLTVTHDPHPVFFLLKKKAAIYIDKNGLGKCEDIVLYEDTAIPHDMLMMGEKQTIPPEQAGKSI